MLQRRVLLTAASAALAMRGRQRPPGPARPGAGDAGPYTLPPLPYAPDANEPHIDALTMTIHHDRHHAAYVANLNAALKDHGQLAALPLDQLLAKLAEVPDSIRTAVRNNGGGHANHSMFWQVMGGKGGAPAGALAEAIARDLGGLAALQAAFNRAGLGQFGSGWVFVTVDRAGKLALVARPNQDTPLMRGRAGAVRQRRVGARLLPEIPEPPGRLSRGVVERGGLGARSPRATTRRRAGTLTM